MKPGTVNPVWLSNTLLFAAPLGILAAGQTMVMLTGGIDLSVVSVATGSAFLMTTTALKFGNVTAVAIGLGLGLAVGAINGVGVALLGVQPLVMTLGTGLMTEGIIIVYSQRILSQRSIVPDFIHAIGSDRLGGLIPLDVFLWLPIAALVVVTLGQTGFGRLLYAIGDNREGCRLAGVRVWRLLLIDYMICALLASIAGFVLVGHTNSADLSLAATYLLPSIAAVIIGGTSIFGGRGGYSGTIVGALILTVLDGLLTLLDSPEPIKQILYGADHLRLGRGLFAADRVEPARVLAAPFRGSRPAGAPTTAIRRRAAGFPGADLDFSKSCGAISGRAGWRNSSVMSSPRKRGSRAAGAEDRRERQRPWTPACAGVTRRGSSRLDCPACELPSLPCGSRAGARRGVGGIAEVFRTFPILADSFNNPFRNLQFLAKNCNSWRGFRTYQGVTRN